MYSPLLQKIPRWNVSILDIGNGMGSWYGSIMNCMLRNTIPCITKPELLSCLLLPS